MKDPNIIHLTKHWYDNLPCCQSSKYGKHWYPARPLGYSSFENRLRAAWLVFTGQADALMWPEDYS